MGETQEMSPKTEAKKATDLAKPGDKTALEASSEEARDSTTTCAGKDRRLEIAEQPGRTHERLIADVVTQGVAINAATAVRFVRPEYGNVSLTDLVASLRESGDAINRNDLTSVERMLCAQGVALNAIFGELARVAQCNLFKNVDAADRYMRLALKAQAQSRMTVETLAAIKARPWSWSSPGKPTSQTGISRLTTAKQPRQSRARAKRNPRQANYWMHMMSNGWTPERRARQAELIKTWRPWEQATGPRSELGKAAVARNAWKGGVEPRFESSHANCRRSVKLSSGGDFLSLDSPLTAFVRFARVSRSPRWAGTMRAMRRR